MPNTLQTTLGFLVLAATVLALIVAVGLFGAADAIQAGSYAKAEAILAAATGKDDARLARQHRADIERCQSAFTEFQCIAMLHK